ncbi:Glycine dehydrogenase (decarboxylating) [Alkaliphilus metalliredigens QYMF]|uniref:Probable glycine dehydrogenase (decarboxylating) subunit 1 n=1 Tax=Alkaliphilus metalliredigens (strain QYMF) TaxID=293826 RepID=A6TMY8_ALKMQ|nr:aminomethyl-transferring glycine dehydrogenase subunit GcvPA [Alkaliphilus metalliredigens]ABR47556.1 Glycine dehydrogenase (decarboxylating) [Alkaliphilus metalliredigens QYMF]
MFPYIPNTVEDEKKMLAAIGLPSIESLFEDIPENVRLNRELNLGKSLSEFELVKYMKSLSNQNKSIEDLTCFMGAGAYDHLIPSTVDHVISRSEFYTAYTPYQAEISQGTLQVIFEYQTMIANLTGMDVANASLYDGSSAIAEAAAMAVDATRRMEVIVSSTVHPESKRVLNTYANFKNIKIVEIESKDGVTDVEQLKNAISKETAAVILQNPNFLGIIEKVEEVEKAIHEQKGLLIMSVDPISLGVLKSPGDLGADIAVGEGQALGNTLSFGGPYLGFMATTKKLMRKMPGRIVGETTDVNGERGFVLTLQTREQHIRREKATSNICSNQALNALAAAVYLTTLGKAGLKEVALQSTQKAHYALKEITKSGKYQLAFNQPFFKEFAVKTDVTAEVVQSGLLEKDILGGYHLEKFDPKLKNMLLFAVTEKRTKGEIEQLARVLGGIK